MKHRLLILRYNYTLAPSAQALKYSNTKFPSRGKQSRRGCFYPTIEYVILPTFPILSLFSPNKKFSTVFVVAIVGFSVVVTRYRYLRNVRTLHERMARYRLAATIDRGPRGSHLRAGKTYLRFVSEQTLEFESSQFNLQFTITGNFLLVWNGENTLICITFIFESRKSRKSVCL